mgnify:CR=1 FL=1
MNKKEEFIYRLSKDNDTTAIVELLKICLGDNDNRTNEYWEWKHNNNPFGKSFVMLAFDKDLLIGVRSFMRWEWSKKSYIYKCVRCVDTVVHPNYRRRGLFSIMTLKGLEIMKNEGVDFVFNTPNSKSLPGNLKMGWKEYGNTGLKVRINNLVKSLYYRVAKSEFSADLINEEHILNNLSTNYLADFISQSIQDESVLRKRISSDYLIWRYLDVPTHKYGVFIDSQDRFLIFFRLNKRGKMRELRICDIIMKSVDEKAIKKAIKLLMNQYYVDLATLTGDNDFTFKSLANKVGFVSVGNRGLTMVLREVNTPIDKFLNRDCWGYTSGDIELF